MNQPAVQAVVFDLGNVFVEWSRERLYEPLIPDPDERRRFLDNVLTADVNMRLDAGETFEHVLGELAAKHPDQRDLVLAFESDWERSLGLVDEQMVELLAELRGRLPVLALTNWSAQTFPVALSRFEWLGWFDAHVVSGRERVTKPDPSIYRILCERHRVRPGHVWFTDDSHANVEAARSQGWRAELFVDAATARVHLSDLGVLG
ncbi:MAG: HAD family phosphatase [Acidimicrobiales bacterium]|nr:HAD family phosphatase [Acidimicrobiales bacterium]